MKCPHCKEVNLTMSERQGIEIDYCPECRGVWLDQGELDKIIERSSATMTAGKRDHHTPPATMTPDSSYSASYQKPYKRKKSFLEDLFD